jgi:heptosyltransferase-2
MILKIDCRHFSGDKPCSFHKNYGVKCDGCNDYYSINFKILIIKLDAVGDVLRTTSILPPLKAKYPGSHITWCTRISSKELFTGNTYVDEVILFEEDAFFRISSEEFQIVINLDTSKVSCSIASLARGKEKYGFVLSPKGFVEPANESAALWLEMSAFDDVKKANEKSYQEIIYTILGLESEIFPPVINIPDEIRLKSQRSLANKISKNKKTIGLNVGVGKKWPGKGWPVKHWKELIRLLKKKKLNLLLLGGPDEKEIINKLSKESKSVINSGTDNSLLEFSAIVNLCDVIVTADSLALHIGTALQKQIIALFGPTSANEIYLYGRGEKIISPKECNCYYKRFCTDEESCMEKITPKNVFSSIESVLK